MEYSKSNEATNNKNNKVTRFNVAREDVTVCLICKKPGHAIEKCFHLRLNVSPIPVQIVESHGAPSSYAVLKKFRGLEW